MPSVASLAHQSKARCDPDVSLIEQCGVPNTETKLECMKLLQTVVKGSQSLSPHSISPGGEPGVAAPSTSNMNYNSNPNLSQGHPIDELTSEPVDESARTNQTLQPGSNSSSTDFGPFVSGLPDDFRQRSSSFNGNFLRGQSAQGPHAAQGIDPLRRFSESTAKTGSYENMTTTSHPTTQLRHSHTVPEIPPIILSNDSGYVTPPNRQQGHTSPSWPNNRPIPWPVHVSPPAAAGTAPPISSAQHYHQRSTSALASMPLPLNQNLTIETGHYQPEPSTPPNIMIGMPIGYQGAAPQSMPPVYSNQPYPRHQDPHSSLTSQGSTPQTPEEGVCLYQRDRKSRLVNAFQQEQAELDKLRAEEQRLRQQLVSVESNDSVDTSGTEQEVHSLTMENKKLAFDIQRLIQITPNPIPVARPRPSQRPDPPPVPPSRPVSQSLQPASEPSVPYRPQPHQPVINPHNRITYPPVYQPPQPTQSGVGTEAINNVITTPPAAVRIPPPPVDTQQTEEVAVEDMWACSQCTLFNHPLITSCEACETPRPRPGNVSATTSPPATGSVS